MSEAVKSPVRRRLTKIGSSVAVTLPKEMREKIGVATGDYVDVTLEDDPISLGKAPAGPNPATVVRLGELFAGYQGDWCSSEPDWGAPAGRELP